MGANTQLNTSSVEEECGGAFFSEVFSYIFSVGYFHFGPESFISPQSEPSELVAFYLCPAVLSGYCCVCESGYCH